MPLKVNAPQSTNCFKCFISRSSSYLEVFCKKSVPKILQNSQESTCAGFSFWYSYKLHAFNFMKASDTDLFLCISRYFSEKLFFEILSRRPHCAKSVRIRSYSGSYFPAFGLNTERYGVSLRIQSECRKIRTRITPNTDTFHAVLLSRKCLSAENFVSILSTIRQKEISSSLLFFNESESFMIVRNTKAILFFLSFPPNCFAPVIFTYFAKKYWKTAYKRKKSFTETQWRNPTNIQNQQEKRQKKVWNMFKVNSKNTKATLMISL